MERTTNKQKKGLGDLEKVNIIKKEEMEVYFGGGPNDGEKKKKGFFSWLFTSPCDGDFPQ
jgi:hypothetical protein